ncbi:MAG: peptidyl-prolyl cis-trans isomerase [Gammaproteobacteria bacterium]|nr:peptidyl-prolyl cis-trans isomerase [Gammaproteobacteria bacterium]
MNFPADETKAGLRKWWRPDVHNEHRSLTLCALGAVLGLAIAGVSLFNARGTRVASVPPEDAAVVNRSPILLSDYAALLHALYNVSPSQATPAQKSATLNSMIREELYVQRGIELGLQNDFTEVRNSLVSAVEAQQEIDANATVPTEQELRDFYQNHIQNFQPEGQMTVTDYVAADLGSAQRAVMSIRSGKDLASAMVADGLQSSGATDDGEEFYFAAEQHLGSTLFAIAKRLRDGQVSDPVSDGGRVHVLAMGYNRQPAPEVYSEARDRVVTDYRTDMIARIRAGMDRFLRERAEVRIAKTLQ